MSEHVEQEPTAEELNGFTEAEYEQRYNSDDESCIRGNGNGKDGE